MSQAHYRIHIPTTDTVGQKLHHLLPAAAHQVLHDAHPRLFNQTWVEGPHHHAQGPMHHLVTVAEDTPETDSHVKSVAHDIAEFANHPEISVYKQADKGPQTWTVVNKNHVPGVGAAPELLDSQGIGVLPPPPTSLRGDGTSIQRASEPGAGVPQVPA